MILLTISFILIVGWIIYKIKRRHRDKFAAELPGDNPLPIFGNALPFLRLNNLQDIVERVRTIVNRYYKYGLVRGWIGPILLVGVWDPEFIQIIADSPNAANKGNIYLHLIGDIFRGLFVVSGSNEWKDLKKPFMKLMAKKYLNNEYHSIFIEKNKKFINFIKRKGCGKEMNIVDDLRHLEFEILSETHLGVSVDELEHPKFFWLENLERYLEYAASMQVKGLIQFLRVFRSIIGTPKIVEQTVNDMLTFNKWVYEEREKQVDSNKSVDEKEFYPDFLVRNSREKSIPLKLAYRQMSDLISGGGDTTSTTLASAVVFFGMFPQLQEKAYQEQVKIFQKDPSREPTVEDLTSMEFLDRFMKETLRIVAPPLFFKEASGDINLGKYTLPAGSLIVFLSEFVHINGKYWEKPMEFYPDHFLPEKEATRPFHAYIPFGVGVRICPGTQYASNSLKMTLSYILRNFKISTNLKFEECKYEYYFMRCLSSGYMVTLHERNT